MPLPECMAQAERVAASGKITLDKCAQDTHVSGLTEVEVEAGLGGGDTALCLGIRCVVLSHRDRADDKPVRNLQWIKIIDDSGFDIPTDPQGRVSAG